MPDLLSISWWRKSYTRMARTYNWGCLIVFSITLVIGFGWNQYGGGGRNQAGQTDQNAVIATVNGQPVTQAQFLSSLPTRGGTGEQYAQTEGAVMDQLVKFAVIRQLAKKYNVRVNDADVDRKIAEEREQKLGKNVTDSQWAEYVTQVHGRMSPADYRDSLAQDPQMLVTALLDKFKSMELVTPEDIKKYNEEVQLRLIQINYGRPRFLDPKHPVKVLTEDEAKKKAEDLLAKARSGTDMAALAKANSDDFTKSRGGDVGFMPEYRKTPSPMGGPAEEQLAASYGKDFAEAVHKTATGQFTDVMKVSSFGTTGYAFAKVEARRDAPPVKPDPKNPNAPAPVTDPKKITEDIKQQRASEKLGDEFKAASKAAKVNFTADGAEAKAYYDYAKASEMQNEAAQAKVAAQIGQPVTTPPPTAAEMEQQQTLANNELEALNKKRPEDSTLALIVARNLKKNLATATSDQKVALRDQIINLYDTALKGIEDRNVRFDLAELYREKGDLTDADAAYQKISHLMDIAPGFDAASLQEEQDARKKLVSGFRSINKPDEAAKEEARVKDLDGKILEARAKEAAQQRSAQGPGGLQNLTPGGAGSQTLTMPAPKPSNGIKR